MPCGGLTPFLRKTMSKRELRRICVNALWRAYSISTSNELAVTREGDDVVSMPCGGLTPFLPDVLANSYLCIGYCVNALWRAYSISTILNGQEHIFIPTCVNALWRAYSISTCRSNRGN